MIPPLIWIAVVVGFFAVICLVVMVLTIINYVKYKQTKTMEIKDLKEGVVKFLGTTYPNKIFTSPISKTKCVFYSYYVRKITGRKQRHVTTISEGTTKGPFLLFDGTGMIKVDVMKASDIGFKNDILEGKGALNPISEGMEYYLNEEMRLDIDPNDFDDIQIMERVIEPERELFVYGDATTDPEPSEKNQKLMVTRKGGLHNLYLFDSEEALDEHLRSERNAVIGITITLSLIFFGLLIPGLAITI